MGKSTRTDYRRLRQEYLLRIQEKISEAFTMSKAELEKLDLPTLKRFFNFLQQNVQTSRIDLESFYKINKKNHSSTLVGHQLFKEGEDF